MLESKIEALTKAIEALTAMLDVNPLSENEVKVSNDPLTTDEPKAKAESDDSKTQPVEIAAIDIDAVTAMALKASRNGHGDAIKAKLAEIGATRISKLDADGLAVFTVWVEGLEQ